MAEIGTPENPEIIEPGARPTQKAPPALSRWRLAAQILRILFAVTLPAIGVDILFAYSVHTAINYGGALPLIGALLLIVPSFLLTLVAGAANLVLWPALLLILSGRATKVPSFRFISVRR